MALLLLSIIQLFNNIKFITSLNVTFIIIEVFSNQKPNVVTVHKVRNAVELDYQGIAVFKSWRT